MFHEDFYFLTKKQIDSENERVRRDDESFGQDADSRSLRRHPGHADGRRFDDVDAFVRQKSSRSHVRAAV